MIISLSRPLGHWELELLTITPSYSAHVSNSEESEFDCTESSHAWDTVDKTYSIQTKRRTGKTRHLLIPISQIETFNQNPPTPSLPATAPPPRFGRTSTPSSSRASPALIAPIPRCPVDTDIVISAVGQAVIPTRAESVPEPLELVPIKSIEFPGTSCRHEPIRIDTPPNPPIQPNPAMATGQDVLNALNNLATNEAALQQVVTDLVTNMNREAAIWATPIAENISAHTSNNNIALTYPNWADFKAAFIARFETADPVTDAKTMLKALYQGKNSVLSYAATFKQYSGCTGYSDANLQDKFYNHLADRVKDGLVYTQANTSLLANLIAEAI
ncbi:hypothetical protein D9757_014137 [Collybiopsis confluens]|uniref:Retrotransposon gag domain-containing protein n=1 Tax=Collybiopsis confluens TaxID=2823264 RepID=A0A8H5CWB6_9AGAR|nr:hypothetical protein D9757_014137 [Collybiopsis confluens]